MARFVRSPTSRGSGPTVRHVRRHTTSGNRTASDRPATDPLLGARSVATAVRLDRGDPGGTIGATSRKAIGPFTHETGVTDVRIDTVEPIRLAAPLDRSFGYAQGWVDRRTATLVRIEATDGTVGWGECFGPLAGTAQIIEELLAPELVGKDPRDVAELYDTCRVVGRRAYQTTVPRPAVSGIDIALWDLTGRLAGEPVATLLGARRRSSVPAYATGHYFRDTVDLEAQYDRIVDEATRNAADLGALKLKVGLSLLGFGADEDVELVRQVLAAVSEETTVMVDANYAYDRPTAEQVGVDLSDLGIRWFEEPIPPENEAGYRLLQRGLSVPIAGGECLSPAAFDRLLADQALDVVQPDVCAIGGITPASRIASRVLADGAGTFVPHVWGTPVAQAASLQLLASTRAAPWIEWDRSPNPLRTSLVRDPPTVDEDGQVPVPAGPGLGVRPDPAAIENYRV